MNVAFTPADIMLPLAQNMKKWSVVACDQYTSAPEYWKAVEETVGDAPSTLHIMLPEIYLEETQRIPEIHRTMDEYLQNKILYTLPDALIYVERCLSDGKMRKGLIGALDLEAYDYNKGASSLCRATEATVPDRIPPRKAVREGASLEMPHVLVLIDDPDQTVIESLGEQKSEMKKLYDFDLMQHSGHIKGYALSSAQKRRVLEGLDALRQKSADKFGSELLYLMGDGNHSLATAKACYQDLKAKLGEAAKDHPARWALVELTNLESEELLFEPIHRVLYNVDKADLLTALTAQFPNAQIGSADQRVTMVADGEEQTVCFHDPTSPLTVGTLQSFLDGYLAAHPDVRIDYIHEDDALRACAKAAGSVGFLLPAIDKNAFFESIVRDGALPRKTFSMGGSADKRFYLECRKIK